MRTERQLATKLGRDPTTEEIAKEAELEPAQVEEIRDLTRVVTSLDRPVGEEDGSSMGEFVQDERSRALRGGRAQLPRPGDSTRGRGPPRGRAQGDPACATGSTATSPRRSARPARRLELKPSEVKQLEEKGLSRLAEAREVEAMREAA